MPSETSYTTDGPSLSSMYRCPNLCVVNLQHYRQTQYTLTPQVRNEDVVQTVASHPSTHAKAHSAPNMALSVDSTCIHANRTSAGQLAACGDDLHARVKTLHTAAPQVCTTECLWWSYRTGNKGPVRKDSRNWAPRLMASKGRLLCTGSE